MNFSLIKKYIRRGRENAYEENERDPERDWRVLLFITVTLFLVAIVFAMYIYSSVEQRSDVGTIEIEKAGKVNVDTLHDTVIRYEGRANELEFLKENGIDIADPSL